MVIAHKAIEEKVVVVRHGGVVEHGGHLRPLGVLDEELARFGVSVDSVYSETSINIFTQEPFVVLLGSVARRLVLHQLRNHLLTGNSPCVNKLSLSTRSVWYWVQAKSKPSGESSSGTPFFLKYASCVNWGTRCSPRIWDLGRAEADF